MVKSGRAKRMEKHHKRNMGAGALNLVSLMDIFTILVFFLMVNSSEVEVLQTNSKIKLPDSVSEKLPENRLIISIDDSNVVVQGRPVAALDGVQQSSENFIEGLKQELQYQAERKGVMPEGGFEITIMGDKEIPYWLLKKIMLTCQSTDFAKISLAVNRLEGVNDDLLAAAGEST